MVDLQKLKIFCLKGTKTMYNAVQFLDRYKIYLNVDILFIIIKETIQSIVYTETTQ